MKPIRNPQEHITQAAMVLFVLLSVGAALASGTALAAESPVKAPASSSTKTPSLDPKLSFAMQALTSDEPAQALNAVRKFLNTHPDSPEGHELAGAACLAQHKLEEAKRELSEALRLDPTRPTAMTLLGHVLLDTNDPKGAEPLFKQALERAPRYVLAYRGLVLALMRQGRMQDAFVQAQESLKRTDGTDFQLKYLLAGIEHELGHHAEAEALLEEVLKAKPEFQEALALQGAVKLDLQKFDEANTILTRVLERDPTSIGARLGMTRIWQADGDLARARKELERVIKEQPNWSRAHFQRGELVLAQGELKTAHESFAHAAKLSPNPAIVHLRAAQRLLNYGQPDAAVAEATTAMNVPELSSVARATLIQAFVMQGRLDVVEQTLNQAIAANPTDPAWPMQLGRFCIAQHRPQDALVQFKKVEEMTPKAMEPLAAQAQVYTLLGDGERALEVANRLVVSQGDTPEARVFLGTIEERLGQSDPAEVDYRRALTQRPHDLEATLALASLYAKTTRTDEALQQLQEASQAHPDSLALLLARALIQQQADRTTEAITTYRRILQRQRYHVVALNNLAFLLSTDPSSLEEARRLAERAHRLAPANPSIMDTLGWVAYTQGDLQPARELLSRAAIAAPDDPQIHYHLGMVYIKQKQLDQARAELTRALAAPTFSEADHAKAALESLQPIAAR